MSAVVTLAVYGVVLIALPALILGGIAWATGAKRQNPTLQNGGKWTLVGSLVLIAFTVASILIAAAL